MPNTPTITNSLRRVFNDGFVARDLAEPLASFDVTADIADVRQFMAIRPLSVVGLRHGGVVAGFVHQDRVDDRPLAEQMESLDDAACVTTTTSLQEIVHILDSQPFVLVFTLGQPVGVIVRADLEKPPMRMWLFGMITLFEMTITKIIQRQYPGNAWHQMLSPARLEKAIALQNERQRRNQSVELLDCLQLTNKGQLFAKSDELRDQYWNVSRNEIRKVMKEFEGLRNNLAHSQPYTQENWSSIRRLADTLDRLVEVPTEFLAPDSLRPDNSVNATE